MPRCGFTVAGIVKSAREKHVSKTFSADPEIVRIIDERAKKRHMSRSAYLISLVVADIEKDEEAKRRKRRK